LYGVVLNTHMENKQQQDQEKFPGYPHYPASEDIMDGRSNAKRVDADMEQMPAFHNSATPHHLSGDIPPATAASRETDSMAEATGNEETDITPEERKILDDAVLPPTIDNDNLQRASLDATDFDGDLLNEESFGQTQSGDGLDIENDSTNQSNDDDEENQYWSIGGTENDELVEGNP